ncbi:MAG: GGDEF domain-containing protein [Clostridia bacterium]
MSFPVYIGWALLIPACFSLVYGFATYRTIGALGYLHKGSFRDKMRSSLPVMLLFTFWGMVNIPLPAVYILAYLVRLPWWYQSKRSGAKELFIINLNHLMSMALHMILIGTAALIREMRMCDLLQVPYWRIATIGVVLAVNTLIAFLIPHWNMIFEVLRTQSECEEVRPFMLFLWFCNIFLLWDSVLCISTTEWRLLPLFLIGSTVLLEFYLFRFLRHIYAILKVRYLEAEHRRLMTELERQNKNAAELRSKSIIDPMTGIFTRRYVTEQVNFLLQANEFFSLVFIDLDHLKRINDSKGHSAGDSYLIRFTKELSVYLRKSDLFARVGGDEFVILLPGCTQEMAEKRMEAIRSYLGGNFHPPFSFSYGISFHGRDSGETADQIFRRADQAMYRDKQARTG